MILSPMPPERPRLNPKAFQPDKTHKGWQPLTSSLSLPRFQTFHEAVALPTIAK